MKVNIKALIIGWLISYIGQLVINKPVVTIFALVGLHGSTDPAKIQQVMAALRTSVPLHIVELITQTLFTIVGVYVAVQIAKRAPLKHSLVLGTLILVSTTLFALGTLRVWPVWYSAFSLLLPLPTAWIAGRISAAKLEKDFSVSINTSPIPAP